MTEITNNSNLENKLWSSAYEKTFKELYNKNPENKWIKSETRELADVVYYLFHEILKMLRLKG